MLITSPELSTSCTNSKIVVVSFKVPAVWVAIFSSRSTLPAAFKVPPAPFIMLCRVISSTSKSSEVAPAVRSSRRLPVILVNLSVLAVKPSADDVKASRINSPELKVELPEAMLRPTPVVSAFAPGISITLAVVTADAIILIISASMLAASISTAISSVSLLSIRSAEAPPATGFSISVGVNTLTRAPPVVTSRNVPVPIAVVPNFNLSLSPSSTPKENCRTPDNAHERYGSPSTAVLFIWNSVVASALVSTNGEMFILKPPSASIDQVFV